MIRALHFPLPLDLTKRPRRDAVVSGGKVLTASEATQTHLKPGPLEPPSTPEPGAWRGESQNVWVDVQTPTPEELERLQDAFALNPLALADALEVGHWSRFEAYPEHITLILRTLAEPEACSDRTERVSYFWFEPSRTLLTLRLEPVDYLERIWQETDRSPNRQPARVFAALLMSGADTFFTYADALEAATDELEEEVFVARSPTRLVREIFRYKHQIMDVRRLVSNARDSVASLARNGNGDAMSVYHRDVVDTLARVYESLDSAREVLSSVLDIHLSVQSSRTNDVVRTLTTVSTLFLPLTFMAGVWGMNFKFMPELEQPWGYAAALLSMLGVALGLVWYFKRRGWW